MTEPEITIQICESFNSIKAKGANKPLGWKNSFALRLSMSVMHANNPHFYFIDLFDCFEIDSTRTRLIKATS
jgi:hypothetical protein